MTPSSPKMDDRLTREQREAFWDRSVRTNGCLVWTGAVTSNGYGSVFIGGKSYRAHRVAYELLKGKIPAGRQIDHLCRNRLCIDPKHLEVVTQKENILRGVGAPAVNARKTHCPSGHPFDGDNLYIKPNGDRQCRICRSVQSKINNRRFRERRKG